MSQPQGFPECGTHVVCSVQRTMALRLLRCPCRLPIGFPCDDLHDRARGLSEWSRYPVEMQAATSMPWRFAWGVGGLQVHSYDKKMSSIYCRTFCLWGGITFATQRQQSDCPWRSTHHLGRLLSAMRRQAHLGTRKARHGGLVMPCALGLVIALGMGFLAIGVVPWTARCTGATLWPYLRRVRLRTSGAGRPIVRAVGTWADGSPSEEQGHTGQPWHRAHRLRGRFASRPTPCEEGVWEVRTFVCYIPRRSVEERQRLLAAWRDSQHAGAGPVHVHY